MSGWRRGASEKISSNLFLKETGNNLKKIFFRKRRPAASELNKNAPFLTELRGKSLLFFTKNFFLVFEDSMKRSINKWAETLAVLEMRRKILCIQDPNLSLKKLSKLIIFCTYTIK